MRSTIEEILHTRHFDGTPEKPENDEITELAHRYWEERMRNHLPGTDLDDWLKAESQLIRQREAAIDEASEESFPASDPPASSQPSAGPPDHPKPKAADERGHKRKRK